MSKMKRIAAAAMAMTLACGMMTGCGGGKNEGAEGENKGGTVAEANTTLKFGCFDYAVSLNPGVITNSAWAVTRYGIGECLFRFNDEMVAEPVLCDTYEVSDDHKTWTFHIREGVKFSNGNDVTAEAVVASLERLYATEGSSTPEKYMDYESLTADNEAGTVTVVTKIAYADLTKNLAYPVFCILDASAEEDIETCPIGTGPYAIVEYTERVGLKMKANEHYWNGEVPFENLEIAFVNDDNTKAMALKSGDVDLVENITSASEADSIKSDDAFEVATTAGIRTGVSFINHEGILGNDALRQAVLMALDTETMCNETVGGMYTAGFSVLPSNLDYNYDKLTNPFGYDVDAANKLLDDAGIVDSDGDGIRELDGQNIVLNHITYVNRNLADFAEAVNMQLKSIGIDTAISSSDADTEWNKMVAGEYDLCSSNWTTVGTGEPVDWLANWYSRGTADYSNYSNDEFDDIYEQFLAELDADARKEQITRMQQILIDDAAVMIHGYYNSSMYSNKAKIDAPIIHTADYYWITNEIKPAK